MQAVLTLVKKAWWHATAILTQACMISMDIMSMGIILQCYYIVCHCRKSVTWYNYASNMFTHAHSELRRKLRFARYELQNSQYIGINTLKAGPVCVCSSRWHFCLCGLLKMRVFEGWARKVCTTELLLYVTAQTDYNLSNCKRACMQCIVSVLTSSGWPVYHFK